MKKILALSTLPIFLFPLVSFAAIGLSFGGHVVSIIPCTCSGGEVVTFDRFFGAGPIPGLGVSLFFQPPAHVFSGSIASSLLFPLHPLSWELGVYIPGVPAICTEGVAPACAPIPTPPVIGAIEYTGMSKFSPF